MNKRDGVSKIVNVEPEKIITSFPFKNFIIIITETNIYAYGQEKFLKGSFKNTYKTNELQRNPNLLD